MLHLDADRLAALADEPPTPEEREHLAACAACARETEAYRTLRASGTLAGGARLDAPLLAWESLAPALRDEGIIRDGRPSAVRPWMRAAAAIRLVAGGVAAGRLTAPRAAAPGGASSLAAPPVGVQNAGFQTAEGTAIVSTDDALKVMERAEHDYRAAAAFLVARDSTTRGDPDRYRARLAALGKLQDAVLAAVAESPDDPVINQYLLSTRSARAVTLQQLGTSLPSGVRLASY